MKTVFIGAGMGCRAVLELYDQGRLGTFDLEIIAVVDIDPDAPGMRFARSRGWRTLASIHEAMALPDLELVIELTGDEDILDDIYFLLPPGARLMDHVLARVFWDLEEVEQNLREQLRQKTELEAQVAEDRARLQEILDTLPDVVMVLDPDMRIMRVNRRFERVTQTPRDRAKGKYCYDAFCKTDPLMNCVDEGCPFVQVMRTQSTVTLVHHSQGGRRGRPGYYQVTASPVFNDDGEIVRIVESSREITEQILLKRETEESARRFRQIVDAVHGIITIKDLEGRYLLVNPRAEHLFGQQQEGMLGKTSDEIFTPAVAELMNACEQEVFKSGGHHVSEDALTLEGKEHVLLSERFPLTDYKGDVVGVCCVARDVTRQRELQREVLQSERLAAVGKLAAGVAHELNNPLTGILTFAEDLMLDAEEGDPEREDFEVIVNETMRCRGIVRDLLDFSRQKAPQRQAMDISPVAARTVNMVQRQASFHDVQLELDLADGLPPAKVDPSQVQQAILNLVINARDAMEARGTIRISSALGADGKSVVLSVSDDGCGISPEDLEKIFEPFYSTKGDQGNGLGLPAVLSIVDQHSGHVDVDSEVGVGTTFHLSFPTTVARGAEA